jgi:hypothetical protein
MKNSAKMFCLNLYPVFPGNGCFEYVDLKGSEVIACIHSFKLVVFFS